MNETVKLGASNWRLESLRLNKRAVSVCIVTRYKKDALGERQIFAPLQQSGSCTHRGNPQHFSSGRSANSVETRCGLENVTLRVPLFFLFFFSLLLPPLVSLSLSFFSHSIANAAVPFPAFTVHITRPYLHMDAVKSNKRVE